MNVDRPLSDCNPSLNAPNAPMELPFSQRAARLSARRCATQGELVHSLRYVYGTPDSQGVDLRLAQEVSDNST